MAQKPLKFDSPDTGNAQVKEEGGIFALQNLPLLGFIGLGILVILGGVYLWQSSQSATNEEAQLALSHVRPIYDRGDFQMAISGDTAEATPGNEIQGLQYIADEWSSTGAGKIAALYLGNCYLTLNQIDQARTAYQASKDADDQLIRAASFAGLGAVAETEGKYDEAAEHYSNAASTDNIELKTPDYLLGAARNYEQAGNTEEAIEYYRKIATQYSTVQQANTQARLALARHDVKF